MLRVIPLIPASLGQLTRVVPLIPASLRQLTRVSHLRSHPIEHTLLLETIQHRFSVFRMHGGLHRATSTTRHDYSPVMALLDLRSLEERTLVADFSSLRETIADLTSGPRIFSSIDIYALRLLARL